MNEKITIGIATMKGREKSLYHVINSLATQCDSLHIYFNNFNSVLPEFLWDIKENYKNVTYFFSEKEAGDLTDFGGFYGIENISGYFISADDDMVYPTDFVHKLIKKVKEYDNKIIAGYHGRIYHDNAKIKSYYHGYKKLLHVNQPLMNDTFVNIVAGLGLCFHTDKLKLKLSDFKQNRMKDIYIAINAQLQNIPRLVMAHSQYYIRQSKDYDVTKSICLQEHMNDTKQVELFNSINWTLQTL